MLRTNLNFAILVVGLLTASAISVGQSHSISTKTVQKSKCDSCPDGIGSLTGDAPLLKIRFSNSEILMVCGYLVKRETPTRIQATDFKVLNCGSDKTLHRVDADEWRTIETKHDTLDITDSLHLRTAPDWGYQLFPFRRWYFSLDKGTIVLHGPVLLFSPPHMTRPRSERAMAFCDSVLSCLKEGIMPEDDFFVLVDLLFLGMISGEKGARERFEKLGQMGVLDGEWSEYYFGTKERFDIVSQKRK